MSEQDPSRTSYAQNVDLARHSMDQRADEAKKAFKAAQEIRQQQSQKEQGRGSKGSEMVKKDRPSPELKPKGSTREAVDRAAHENQLAIEKMRAAAAHKDAAQRNLAIQQQKDRGRG